METRELESILRRIGCQRIQIRNQNMMATCPVHDETHPSWGININEPHAHGCFSCGFSGTLLTLLQKFNFPSDFIEECCGVENFVLSLDSLVLNGKKASSVLHPVEHTLVYPYRRTKEVSKYLSGKRKLSAQKMFEVELYYDSKNHAVIFPHWLNGVFLGATERLIAVEHGMKTLAMFDLHKRSTLYTPTGKIVGGTQILVEGEVDALKVYSAGYDNVSALCFGRLTQDQVSILRMCGVTEVVLFFDKDALKSGETMTAAERFTQRAVEMLKPYMKVRVVKYPNYYGADEKVDPAILNIDVIQKCIRKSKVYIGLDKPLRRS